MTRIDLSGEAAVITGGGSGIGLAIAREFVAAGAKVTLVGRREGVLAAAGFLVSPFKLARSASMRLITRCGAGSASRIGSTTLPACVFLNSSTRASS